MKTKTIRTILHSGLSILTLPATALAGTDPYALSLEQLMNIPVMISSRKALSQRETPSSVSVITAEEIRNSGARDLIDVLRQVPGFDFRVSVNNGLAIGMRGQIGSDGRVLMLVDGIDVNEHRYGSAIIGQGFPIEQIARIEIIRGSALALYGGTALLGVINIISKSAEELNGVHIGAGAGMTTSGVNSREYASLMIGKDGPVKFTAMAHLGRALRSDRTYQDITGATFNMANANAIRPAYVNMGLQSGDFSARYLHDETRVNDRDSSYMIRPADYQNYY
jgi:outer membrane cobalamin receptor